MMPIVQLFRTGDGALAVVLPAEVVFDIPSSKVYTDPSDGTPCFDYCGDIRLALRRPESGPGSHIEGPRFYVPVCLFRRGGQQLQLMVIMLFGPLLSQAVTEYLEEQVTHQRKVEVTDSALNNMVDEVVADAAVAAGNQ